MSEFAVSRLVIPHVVIPPAVVEARRARGVAAGHARKRRLAEIMASPAWFWRYPQSPRLATTKKGRKPLSFGRCCAETGILIAMVISLCCKPPHAGVTTVGVKCLKRNASKSTRKPLHIWII